MNQQNINNHINLKGFMIGNGCIGNKIGGCADEEGLKIHVDFYHEHGLFSNVRSYIQRQTEVNSYSFLHIGSL